MNTFWIRLFGHPVVTMMSLIATVPDGRNQKSIHPKWSLDGMRLTIHPNHEGGYAAYVIPVFGGTPRHISPQDRAWF